MLIRLKQTDWFIFVYSSLHYIHKKDSHSSVARKKDSLLNFYRDWKINSIFCFDFYGLLQR